MLTLRAGESSLALAPETGGALLGWTVGRLQVLRRALPDAIVSGQVRGLAGFPLVPFANRIADGRFRWDGRDHQLDRNFGDHPHTIHGVGWQSAWTVRDASAAAAVLTLVHDARGQQARRWPFAFAAEQHIALTAQGLQVTLRVTNRHAGPAPAGLGLHPYFPRSSFGTLRFAAEGVWRNGPDSLPSRHVAVPAAWDHSGGRPIGRLALDQCFTGWDGAAHIEGHALGLTLQAGPATRYLQVYTPAGQDFFCVEPVSHMPDAINRAAHPMRVLGPGESFAAEITVRVALSSQT